MTLSEQSMERIRVLAALLVTADDEDLCRVAIDVFRSIFYYGFVIGFLIGVIVTGLVML